MGRAGARAPGDVINHYGDKVFHQASGRPELLVVLHPLQFVQPPVRPA